MKLVIGSCHGGEDNGSKQRGMPAAAKVTERVMLLLQAGHGALRRAVSHLKQPHSALLQQITALQSAAVAQCQQPSQAKDATQQGQGTSLQTGTALNNTGRSSGSSSVEHSTGSQGSGVLELAASLNGTSADQAAHVAAARPAAAPSWSEWLPSSSSTSRQQSANPGTSSHSGNTSSSHKHRRRRKGKASTRSSGSVGSSMVSTAGAADQPCVHPGANGTSSSPTTLSAVLSPEGGISLAAAGYGASNDEEEESLDASSCLAYCQEVAAGGLTCVCCAWGTVQEAAAVYQLLECFPNAVGEEVGGAGDLLADVWSLHAAYTLLRAEQLCTMLTFLHLRLIVASMNLLLWPPCCTLAHETPACAQLTATPHAQPSPLPLHN
jgi:hypothetical protein